MLTALDLTYQKEELEMIEFLRSIFRSDPGKKILKERDHLYEKSVALQRNGDLREYGKVMKRIEELEEEYARVSGESSGE